ncbi:hypothetical protein EON62_04110 [archaeon]|nr:MAG: hypothetical protein EON62_04110 [archaeon]
MPGCCRPAGRGRRLPAVGFRARGTCVPPVRYLPSCVAAAAALLRSASVAAVIPRTLDVVRCACVQPNPQYTWFDTGVRLNEGGDWTGYMLNMTSGTWLTPNDTNAYLWSHQLLVVIPKTVTPNFNNAAALWITGGSRTSGVPGEFDEDVLVCASLATSTGTVCSVLYQVPYQPIVFAADPLHKSRSEDAAVGFTWLQYMLYHNDQPEWILYFPMARAAVKAMDAV